MRGASSTARKSSRFSNSRYYAVGALLNLAFASPRNRDALAAERALEGVADCAAAAAGDLDQQRLCCRAFWILATPVATPVDKGAAPRPAAAALSDARLAVVPAAMLAFAEDRALQHFACGAIINLAAASTDARRALGRVDGCRAVAGALRAYPRDARIAEYACRAAVYLARGDPENKDLFFRFGVRALAEKTAALFAATPAVAAWADRLQREL